MLKTFGDILDYISQGLTVYIWYNQNESDAKRASDTVEKIIAEFRKQTGPD